MDRDLLASDYSFNTSRTQSLSEGVAFFFAFDSSWCLVFFVVDSLPLSITQTLHIYTRNSIINVFNKNIDRDLTCFVHQVKQINKIQSENQGFCFKTAQLIFCSLVAALY